MNNGESYLIKARSEAVKKSSILSILKEKEFQIKADLVKTRQQADEIIRNAKHEAERLIEEAKQKAEKDANKKIQIEIEKAKKMAEEILKEAHDKVPEIEQDLKERIQQLSEFIISIILNEITPDFLNKRR